MNWKIKCAVGAGVALLGFFFPVCITTALAIGVGGILFVSGCLSIISCIED